mgnify:CR=1 FL=1
MFLMTKYFGEEMIKKRNGKIINIGSDITYKNIENKPNDKAPKPNLGLRSVTDFTPNVDQFQTGLMT